MAQHAPGAFGGLRNVLFGGEVGRRAPRRGGAQAWRAQPPYQWVWTNRDDHVRDLLRGTCGARKTHRTIPIGKPIANTTIYVLDVWGSPVPIGVAGEIHVGDPGVARGYVDAPELTAECFVPDPFSTQPRARLYRTGDRGRWLADGTVECLGRMDHPASQLFQQHLRITAALLVPLPRRRQIVGRSRRKPPFCTK